MTNKNKLPIVTLLTDFGLRDEYVSVMKGVILKHAREAQIVDISHLIHPQDIGTAAHILARSYRYFPEQSIHLVIVDPGVGSDRAILAVAADGHYFVGPDNGIFTFLFDGTKDLTIHRINISSLRVSTISSTFHGRDIMAPVAGQLAIGLDISELGPQIDAGKCHRLALPVCTRLAGTLHGEIIHIDTFGNLCTNIRKQDIEDFSPYDKISIQVANNLIVPLLASYPAQEKGKALALFDSHDYLEIAVCQGNAAQKLHLELGAKITVSFR